MKIGEQKHHHPYAIQAYEYAHTSQAPNLSLKNHRPDLSSQAKLKAGWWRPRAVSLVISCPAFFGFLRMRILRRSGFGVVGFLSRTIHGSAAHGFRNGEWIL
jgi:hypothetical protein